MILLGAVAAAPGDPSDGEPLPATVPKVDSGAPARKALEGAWRDHAAGKKGAALQLLSRDWEASLQVLVDMLYSRPFPPRPEKIGDKLLAELVAQLGADEWRIREQATKKLLALGPGVHDRLRKHLTDAELEVRMRIQQVLDAGKPASAEQRARRTALNRAATRLMELSIPMEVIRRVARRNLLRLAADDHVEPLWNNRPRGPLLASLRCSDDPKDRDLLALAIAEADTNLRKLLETVLRQGLTGRTCPSIARHWKAKLPAHDYGDAMFRLLDPARPEVFARALSHVRRDRRLYEHLRTIRKDIRRESLREAVDRILQGARQAAARRSRLYPHLTGADDEAFAKAVAELTSGSSALHGQEVLGRLRPVLRGRNRKRKLVVLQHLGRLKGPGAAKSVADELAAFLTDSDAELQPAAGRALMQLRENNPAKDDVVGQLIRRTSDLKRLDAMVKVLQRHSARIDEMDKQVSEEYRRLMAAGRQRAARGEKLTFQQRRVFDENRRKAAHLQRELAATDCLLNAVMMQKVERREEQARKRQEENKRRWQEAQKRRSSSRPARP